MQPSPLDAAIDAVLRGGVVAFPTDTFYGLAADPRSSAAVRRIFEIKERPQDQPIPLIAADLDQVRAHVGSLSVLAERLADAFWPGPLTLIISASTELCQEVHLGTSRVAVRVPDHAIARALAAGVGCAVTSTSANISGAPPAVALDDVVASLGDRIDAAVDGGRLTGGLPSTIVDTTGVTPVLIRPGAVAWDRVLKFAG